MAVVIPRLDKFRRNRLLSRATRAARRFAGVEELEPRVLLSVTGTVTSHAGSFVFGMTAWNMSGEVNGLIAQDDYSSDFNQYGSHSWAAGWTVGTDPGWMGGSSLMAIARTLSSETQGFVAQSASTAFEDYNVSIRPLKPLPPSYDLSTIYIPLISKFNLSVTIDGDPGTTGETSTSRAYVEVYCSDGTQHNLSNDQLDWPGDLGKASAPGHIIQNLNPSFSNTLAYSPVNTGSNYLCISIHGACNSMVANVNPPIGNMSNNASASVSSIAFDQTAFNASQGIKTFQLSDYFQLLYGVDSTNKGPKNGTTTTTYTCVTPEITAPGDSTGSGTTTTGDTTPTFTGIALSGAKPLKSGLVDIFLNGTQAATGTVTNGAYRATIITPLAAGAYSVTASVGPTSAQMGAQSDPLMLVIDTSLPTGDTLDVALGAGGVKSVTFVDPDGTQAVLKLTAGVATLHFTGNGLLKTGTSAVTVSAVSGAQLAAVDITGDTSKATLTATASKTVKTADATIVVGAITAAGPIATMNLTGIDLQGNLTVGGKIGALTLNNMSGGTLQALAIGTCKLSQDLQMATLTLSQAVLPDPKVLGLGTLTVGGAANNVALNASGGIGKITLGQAMNCALTAGGMIGTMTIAGLANGAINAVALGALQVTQDLRDANIILSQPVVPGAAKTLALGALTVGGAIDGSLISAAGNIGTVTAGRILASSIFAGVDTAQNAPGVLPDQAQDFAADATLGTLTLTGVKGQAVSFQDSYVAASTLGKIALSGLPADHTAGGGVAGRNLTTLYTRSAGKTPVSVKGPLSAPSTLDALDAFVARLV